jgi:DNA-binding IclR family transcriptional regulator
MEILEVVADRPMRASDIAGRLGLKWTTAHRSLTYLLDNGYLRRDEASGIYRIGPRLHYLGQSYLRNHPLLDAASTALRALAHQTGASAQLNERVGFEATVLMAADPTLEIVPKTSAEYHFPLHTGAKGQVLLAFSEPEVFLDMTSRPLPALTHRTIVDPAELARVLASIREHGYRVTREDVQRGTGSVAAPIFDGSGELAGAACVIVRAGELTEERTEELVAAVTGLTRQASVRLGWRYGDTALATHRWTEVTVPG